ncbi:LamG-like jellyroll fold domain-containing protein [Streptomyces sp. NBC_01013]|uniref:LamG-like jellyroll fold domain-containing protein n=1 Tax=Streptomyces sp. NBC_01013 TaxID=2903718 RepID=UPI00386BF95C|nr:hypothetical protein OG538_35335 [Streptomyces sp. NBC_01013]
MKGPVVDESGSFTVSASVELDSKALEEKPLGYTGQIAGQRTDNESAWALWVTKFANGMYQWKFTRTGFDSDGQVESAEVMAEELAETDTWVEVTGVYDAQESSGSADATYGQLHLYVGTSHQPSGPNSAFTAAQPGSDELAIGRGAKGGATGNYLPGSLQSLKIWTGAMTSDQVSAEVQAASGAG